MASPGAICYRTTMLRRVLRVNGVEPIADPTPGTTPEIAVVPTSGWRLMGWAVLWCLLSCLGAVVASLVIGAIVSVTSLKDRVGAADLPMLYGFAGMVGTATVLAWIALDRAAQDRRGDWRAGIGDGAIERPWAVALITVAMSAYAALITAGQLSASPEALRRMIGTSPFLIGVGALLLVVAAPLAEELFFRGWLWTGLRVRWGAGATAAATSALWLTLHLPDGVGRVILLVPAALALPLARQCGGSVRASIVVHACNNAAVAVTPLIALWLGWLAAP